MAHYDCKNCGHYLGIGFGECEACTPQEFFDLQNKIKDLDDLSGHAWNNKTAKLRSDFIKEYLEENGYNHLVAQLEGLRKSHLYK
tara:strand:- start:50 stop:304 length:255 start_codon:yes stop_codon:yes gene_type:complete